MKGKIKKPFTLLKASLLMGCSVVLAIVLLVANLILNNYKELITTYTQTTGYKMTEEELAACEEVVSEGAVLLMNRGGLPLEKSERKVAFLGQTSVNFIYGGAGSGSGNTSTADNLKGVFENAGFTVNASLWEFYTTGQGKDYRRAVPDSTGKGVYKVGEVPKSVYTEDVKNSMTDDFGVCVIGRVGSESSDLLQNEDPSKGYLEMTQEELDMIKLACEKYSKVILLVNTNNAVELGFLDDAEFANVKAALWVGGVGQTGIRAIPKIFTGEVNPSGRLADTYAYSSRSAPSYANMGDFDITNSKVTNGNKYTVYQEGIYVGYRYYETRYEDVVSGRPKAGSYDYAAQVQFPFGHGLSYTEFEWSDFSLTPSSDGKQFTVSVTVANIGDRAGKDVVEIYAQSPYTDYDIEYGIEKASVELIGYAKTDLLDPVGGENSSQTISLTFDKGILKSYDAQEAGTYILEAGNYYITAGRNAHEALNNIIEKKMSVENDYTADRQKMVGMGNAAMADVFVQTETDSETYTVSHTGAKIINQFDDVAIENYESDCKFVSRSDWEGTVPTAAYKNGNWQAGNKMLADLEFYKPQNDASLKRSSFGSTSTAYTVQELVRANEGYSSKKWNELALQLTWKEACDLVRKGGYATLEMASIGLPATIDKDGPAGISGTLVGGTSCMSWPVEVVMASTWNDELIERVGTFIGDDSIASGIAGWYAPGANIHRSPYSGRNFEYFSEDGLLSGKIGAAEMRGVRARGVIAYAKHFALNDQETNRYGGAVFANEQSIREIYLKGFEYIVEEGDAVAMMASMNRVGTRWTGAHRGLMTDVLRGEWGFEGVVITDQASFPQMGYQDMVSGLWAGTDLWLNTNNSLWKEVRDDYENNAVIADAVARAAKNIIYAVGHSNAVNRYEASGEFTTGEFERSEMAPWLKWLIVVDVVVGILCCVGIVLPAVILVIKKRRGDKLVWRYKAENDGQSGENH